jgi:hypothetical protein
VFRFEEAKKVKPKLVTIGFGPYRKILPEIKVSIWAAGQAMQGSAVASVPPFTLSLLILARLPGGTASFLGALSVLAAGGADFIERRPFWQRTQNLLGLA